MKRKRELCSHTLFDWYKHHLTSLERILSYNEIQDKLVVYYEDLIEDKGDIKRKILSFFGAESLSDEELLKSSNESKKRKQDNITLNSDNKLTHHYSSIPDIEKNQYEEVTENLIHRYRELIGRYSKSRGI